MYLSIHKLMLCILTLFSVISSIRYVFLIESMLRRDLTGRFLLPTGQVYAIMLNGYLSLG